VSWYRIEGELPQHEKYAPLSDAAFRLSITAGAWCANRLTDGKIPRKMVQCLTRAPLGEALTVTVQELLDAGIWEESPDDESIWLIHDFLDWNMSRAQWEAKTAAGSAGGRAKAASRASTCSSKTLAPASHQLEQTASTCSSVPLADSDSDSDLRDPAKAAASLQDLTGRPSVERPAPEQPPQRLPTRRERATSDLSALPIAELARRCRENPHDGGFASPQDRPEVKQVHEAWCSAVGLSIRPLGYLSDRNRPLRAILEALETHPLGDVLRACQAAAKDPWCRGEVAERNGTPGRKHGIEDMTPTVLRRLLDAADAAQPRNDSPGFRRVQAMLEAEKLREAGIAG
jgi:hypothetical protein